MARETDLQSRSVGALRQVTIRHIAATIILRRARESVLGANTQIWGTSAYVMMHIIK